MKNERKDTMRRCDYCACQGKCDEVQQNHCIEEEKEKEFRLIWDDALAHGY